MTKKTGIFTKIYMALVLLFLYAPIFVLVVFSFNEGKSMSKWTGFSFTWYEQLFSDARILNALYISLSVAVLSAIIATIIGTLAAIGIHNMRRRTKTAVLNVTYIPMLNPDIVTGISLMLLFLFFNIPRGYLTLLLAHISFNVPYVIFSVLPRLRQMRPQMYEAALDLGATPFYALRKVIIPDIRPGIITGAILAFTLSLDDFVISMFTSQSAQNLSVTIYSMARRGLNPKINALSTLMFFSVIILLVIVNRRSSRDKNNLKETVK
ncbi:MAG: ABC transporter permease [Christensenellales bacterium]|jgi:spermidine/putrescine transport system permease protein